jgi:hypothetical protein
MTAGDEYRIKAAEFRARAHAETNRAMRAEFENLARAYLRLAEQAERNTKLDVTYEPPPPKLNEPEVNR